jgi:hypothetical protein
LAAPAEVLDYMGESFDFNKILPMPEVFNGHSPHHGVVEVAKFAMGLITVTDLEKSPAEAFKAGDYGAAASILERSNTIRHLRSGPYPKDYSDKDFADFLQCCRGIKETGFAYWYDWSCAHWGTKWNAYSVKRVSPTIVRFQTAGSAPLPVLYALSLRFPLALLTLRWADEDYGCNAGVMSWLDGSESGGLLENNSREARDLAFELCYANALPEGATRNVETGELTYAGD